MLVPDAIPGGIWGPGHSAKSSAPPQSSCCETGETRKMPVRTDGL